MCIVSVIAVLGMLLYHNCKNDLRYPFLYHVKVFLDCLKDGIQRAGLSLGLHRAFCIVGYCNWHTILQMEIHHNYCKMQPWGQNILTLNTCRLQNRVYFQTHVAERAVAECYPDGSAEEERHRWTREPVAALQEFPAEPQQISCWYKQLPHSCEEPGLL